MNDTIPNELAVLSNAYRALAQSRTVEEVKELRNKAEAARKYARCAKMGLEKQNQCAEFKLCCERKAGRLLIELGMVRGRPAKRKKSHHGTFLDDLGINKNQSSRWQQEAKVPEKLLQLYFAKARREGKEITAQGLLRLARRTSSNLAARKRHPQASVITLPASDLDEASDLEGGGARELVTELLEERALLASVLDEFCSKEVVRSEFIQRRVVGRLLADMYDRLMALFGLLGIENSRMSAQRCDPAVPACAVGG